MRDTALPLRASTEPGEHRTALLPLVIGVTGHRDLREADLAVLEARVRDVLSNLRRQYPSTPLVLLSALAEGADRLVARIGLQLGARLVVPLPFARNRYEEDFGPDGSASRQEFTTFLAAADQWFELPADPGNRGASASELTDARDGQYARVGAYVARQCHLLLALWDGLDSAQLGGTAHIVRMKLDGGADYQHDCLSPIEPSDVGPVLHIATPRRNSVALPANPFALETLLPEQGGFSLESFQSFEEFNADVLRNGDRLDSTRRLSAARLLPEEHADRLSKSLRDLRTAFATCDALAIHFQGRTLSMLRDLFIIVFMGAGVFTLYAHAWQHTLVFVAYLALVGAAWARWYMGRVGKFQTKYQDYRALAEGLRVQFFWTLVGLTDLIDTSYLRKQRGELEWIRAAVRGWTIWGSATAAAPSLDEALPSVRGYWIEDQTNFFGEAARREHRRHRVCGRISGVLFWAFVVQAGLLVGAAVWGHAGAHPPGHLKEVLLITIALTAVGGALVHNYGEKRAFSEHAKHYQRMAVLFSRGGRGLATTLHGRDPATIRALVRELGREALAENGDWVLLHRQRPIEVPETEGMRGTLPEILR